MGDQQILAVSPVRVYHREETGQVEIVERRLGLVEDAESPRIPTRPAQEHAEQERQREQGPFAPGQYTQGPPALPPQPQPNLHPVLREIQDPGRSLEHPRHHLPERIPYPAKGLRETCLYLFVHGLYYAVEFVGRCLCVGPLGRDELVAFAQSLFLGEGEEVYVSKALELAGERLAFSVGALLVFLGLLAGRFEGGAPLSLYLLAGLGRRGFSPGELFGEAFGLRAGGSELTCEIHPLARERRALVGDPAVCFCGLSAETPQGISATAYGRGEFCGRPRRRVGERISVVCSF